MATAATAEVVDEDEIAGGPVIDDLPAAVAALASCGVLRSSASADFAWGEAPS